MTGIPTSLPNAGLPPPASAATAGLAILLAELTETLAKLPPGSQIPALVTQILQQQPPEPQQTASKTPNLAVLVQLDTPDGPAQVKLPFPLPVGSKLEIAVTQSGPQPQWRLLTVDGKPAPQVALTLTATPAAAPPPVTNAAATEPMTTRPPAAPGFPATIVKAADPALPAGTTILVRIVSLTPPASSTPTPSEPPPVTVVQTPAPEEQTQPNALPSPDQEPAPEPEPEPRVPQASVPATEPQKAISPVSTPTPGLPSLPAAAPASVAPPPPVQSAATTLPTEITGQVLPNTDAGQPLVKTPIGLLALPVEPQSLPPGTEITLAVAGKPVRPPPDPVVIAAPTPDDPPDRALPRKLAQMLDSLPDDDGGKLAESVRERIPAPGPKLAAQMLSLIASSQQSQPAQSLTRWLGPDVAAALTHAAPQAIESLSKHWETLSQPVQGPDGGEWRSLMIPFLIAPPQQMTTIRLTTRHRSRGLDPAEREKGTRFLLDLDLSALGQMQFDGLVKRQHKRFDLIIRTLQPLTGEMRRDIDGLFVNGLMNFGLQGSVGFQSDGRFTQTKPLARDGNGIIFA